MDEEKKNSNIFKNIDIKWLSSKISSRFSGRLKKGPVTKWKFSTILVIILLVATIVLTTLIILKTVFDVKNLNARAEELNNISNYNTNLLNTNSYTKEEAGNFKEIDELIEYNSRIKSLDANFAQYLKDIQAPYDNFLKYLLLPNLNIWKDPFMWDIDYSVIWTKYLEKNPYNDIDLIDKWSNFIKDVWKNNEYNEINSIEIWEMVEEWENFYIPVRVSYIAPSHRWFLLLIEKLSITSNQKNISLINELIYNLWEIIKTDNPDGVLAVQETYPWFSQDKAIWFSLYQRVKWETDNSLINDEIINKAIKKIALCGDESKEYCYYKFRNKYRDLPSVAYSIWLEASWTWSMNKTEQLRNFLKDLPQVIKVIDFTYDWEEIKDMVNYTTKQYRWTINFRIYWDGLSNEEVVEIQKLLWEKCLWVDLTPDAALSQIKWKLTNIWNDTNIDTYSTLMLMELETLIWDIANSFNWLTNYKKVVKTFEIYRMLNEWNICNL